MVNLRTTAEARERLERMARVLLSPLRIKIMAALSISPMSPKMLQGEIGGDPEYELNTIDENLKELMRYGWVELLDQKTGGTRRSAVEHIYRATQLPVFDNVIWFALPKPMREMVSLRIFEALTKRVKGALAAGTMDARDDRHFTWTGGLLDPLGWQRLSERVDALFELILEEMKAARLRLVESGEHPIPVTVALLSFESPADRFWRDSSRRQLTETRGPVSSPHALPLRMAKVMINELRLLILSELSTRPMSAKMFCEEFGSTEISEKKVYRAFEVLKRFDWLESVDAKTGERQRGGREQFYRAARPPVLGDDTWPALPESMKRMVSGEIFEALAVRVREAMEAGTMDARRDRHFTWTPGLLDQLGWERVIEGVDALFEFLGEELRCADGRLARSDEEPIPVTVALAAFESPAPQTGSGFGPPLG